MTEREKMLAGEYADTSDPELQGLFERAHKATARLNSLAITSPGYREAVRELVPGIPDSSFIAPPFHCDYGLNIRLGEKVFINFNCCFLDGGGVEIGDHTLIGPSVQIYTPHHPVDYLERRKTIEKSLKVVIGDDCWIGGGAVILPGVKIGNRCIIGAGSVVTADVPDDSLAVGNPAVVKKRLDGGRN